jgi:uncharacterized protein (TIGR02646 family)
MIRVSRGQAPRRLTTARQRELKRLRALWRTNPSVLGQLRSTYQVAKKALWLAQHRKCAYCEFFEQLDQNDVEHFRPKSGARRARGRPEETGYWWLAWTWRNLLFACAACNRTHKATWFPLEPGSRPLKPWQQPPGQERPLLIDPSSEDPIDHLRFEPYRKQGEEHWRPNPRAGSQRGWKTIEVLGLDRPGLLDLYKLHVDQEVRPKVNRLRAEMRSNTSTRVTRLWREVTRELLDRRRPFTALSYDALDHFMPEPERQRWRLTLPRPGMSVMKAGALRR